ncbi:MAG: alanine--tRNA ligase, partial [Balneolaceae bacterium]
YDTDLFSPLLDRIGELSGISYGDDRQTDIAMRVIADHIRAVSFAIADGASPGNEGRGYVVRRILRRAIRYGWDRLELKKPFMHKLVAVLGEQFSEVFPVLVEQQQYVTNVIRAEEQGFLKTLGQGIQLFEEMVEDAEQLSGEDAFKLHDTYGFPIDLTELMARERGISVDTEGFERLMNQQKKRAREAGKFDTGSSGKGEWKVVSESESEGSEFVGYDELETESNILAWREQGKHYAVILDKTPFYAESGGQVADTGILSSGEQHLRVLDVQRNNDDIIHIVDQRPEEAETVWKAMIDRERRREIRKHHSATHLVHAALREVLGDHVAQKGSLVDEHHLRFDFSHYEQITPSQLDRIERIVNERVQQNIPKKEERAVPIEEAKKRGAMMLFGEKYGEQVRVITFDDAFSVELCGGTHVDATGEIGYFRFLNESSAAAGIRRIEAVAGYPADEYLRKEKHQLGAIRQAIGQTEDPVSDIQRILEERKQLQKEVERLRLQRSSSKLDELIQNAEALNGSVNIATGEIDGADMDLLKQLGYEALEKTGKNTVIVLGSRDRKEGKVYLAAAVTGDLISEKGLKAGSLVGELGKKLGGGGGGQPNLATAGGRFPDKLEEVLGSVRTLVEKHLKD